LCACFDASTHPTRHSVAVHDGERAGDIVAVAGRLARPLLVGSSSGAVAALEAALTSPRAAEVSIQTI
jgi:hypothetical protein